MSAQRGSSAALILHEKDDVAVLLRPVTAGETVLATGAGAGVTLEVRASLPLGHKIALRPLPVGLHVRKYGEIIGRLTATAAAGDHVHVHNLTSLRASPKEPALDGAPEASLPRAHPEDEQGGGRS